MTDCTPSEDPSGLAEATRLVRGGLNRSPHRETAEALYLTSGYVYDSAQEAMQAFDGTRDRFVYSRFANPTVAMFEQRLASIEGAAYCRGTASGMGAVHAALVSGLKAGDRVVASRALFGSCQWIVTNLLPKMGVESVLIDGTDPKAWEQALSQPTALTFLETPSNPTLEIIDLAHVAKLSKAAGARLVVDNVFATPLGQKPLAFGADVVVYSTTKHIDGQGRCLGGAILSNDEAFLDDHLSPFLRHTGPAMSPFNAWVMLKGMETLALRLERACATAARLADDLAGHKALRKVAYPFRDDHPQVALAKAQMRFGGTMLALELEGGREGAFRFLDRLQVVDISNNLGDSKSLATHPGTTTHQRLSEEERTELGITPGLVRLSVGLEDPQDLLADLMRALG